MFKQRPVSKLLKKNNDTNRQLKVALYIRVSTEDQAEKYGPDMQKATIENFIKTRGKLDDGRDAMVIENEKYIYFDSISGATPLEERPGFGQLMEDILTAPKGRKPFDLVAVYKVDRFARRLKILLHTIEFFEEHDIEFISANESIDTSTPFGRAILGIMGVIAELEVETTRMRSQDGRKSAFNRGTVNSIAPIGYTKDAEKRLLVLESEAELVQRIYHLFVFERLSTELIAQRLTKESVPSPDALARLHHKRKGDTKKKHGDSFWRGEKIRAILQDEVYIGHLYGNKSNKEGKTARSEWVLSEYKHTPIIEKALFEKAQQRLTASANKVISRRKEERQYMLRGLLKCGYCRQLESQMLTWHGLEKKKGAQLSYFYCCGGKTTAKHSKPCPTLPIPGDQLEEYIINFVKSLLDDPQAVYQYQLNLQSTKVRVKVLKKEREKHRIQLNQVPIRKDNLSQQHERGVIDSIEELDQRMKKVEAEEKELTKRIDEIDRLLGQQALSEGYTRSFVEFSERYRPALDDAFKNPDDIYELLHGLIHKIVIYSRPVDHQFDKIAGKKKDGQQMPNEIKIELKLPQEIIGNLVESKFQPKRSVLRHGGDSNP